MTVISVILTLNNFILIPNNPPKSFGENKIIW